MQTCVKMTIRGGTGAGASSDQPEQELPEEVVRQLGLLPTDPEASHKAMKALRERALVSGSTAEIEAEVARFAALIDLAEELFPTPKTSLENFCDLKVEDTEFERKVSFILPKGMSFKDIFNWANQHCRDNFERKAVCCGNLFLDAGVEDIALTNREYQFTILKNSFNSTRVQQSELLKQKGLVWADRAILTAAAALYRVKNGFPNDFFNIGSINDPGDLFPGMWVRTAGAPKTLGTYSDGLDALDLNIIDIGSSNEVCAGN